MSTNSTKLLFTNASAKYILEAFGKSINSEGIIIEKSTGEPIYTPEGEELTLQTLGAIKKGSEIFMKDDLFSIINIAEGKY